MYKKTVFGVVMGLALVVAPVAQAANVSDILARMDEIIKEMQSLRTEFDGLSAQVPANGSTAGSVLGAQTSARLTQTIAYGETNEDIRLIQLLLRTDPDIYPYGVASGFFGDNTTEAIRNLQSRFNLDPVGVVGPATTALLEAFFAKYPGTDFPSDALASDPRVKGASTSAGDSGLSGQIAAVQAEISKLTGSGSTGSTGSVRSIEAEFDRGEASVKIEYINGNTKRLIVAADDEDELVEAINDRTGLSTSVIRAALEIEEEDKDDNDADEDDAEDALDDAEDALDDAEEAIEEADDDGDDVDWAEDTLKEAEELFEEAEDAYDDEDWDEAVEKAEEAKDLAEEAEDRIGEEEGSKKGDSDEIEEIEAEVVDEDETEITVKYEDDDDYEFTVEEDKIDEIIEEVADELDMDEDDVEDLIEFDFGDVDEIDVLVDEDEDEADVTVTYESGVERRFTIDADDEDEMIEDIAKEIDEDEDDVEDWTDFDY
ncbi:MAG: peptidoglycan-binding protein [Candidatus Paceibacterota bacterium]